jgi:hypothetical protein
MKVFLNLLLFLDGNLVLFNAKDEVIYWSSGTSGHSDSFLLLQDDGNLAIKDVNEDIVWTSNSLSNCTGIIKQIIYFYFEA